MPIHICPLEMEYYCKLLLIMIYFKPMKKYLIISVLFFPMLILAKPLPKPLRGIYINPYACYNISYINKLMDSMKRYDLNTVIIDVKADNGIIPFTVNDKRLKKASKNIYDIDKIVNLFHKNKFIIIGRIVTFKDNIRANENKGEYAVINKYTKKPWRDSGGTYWVDPYNIDNWDYNICVANEVLSRGFDSVQFDYVRFPSDGDIGKCAYPSRIGNYYYSDIIEIFVYYAKYHLKEYDIGVDVFGYLPWLKRIINIGQDMSMITNQADIISPMLYPSHFGNRFLLDSTRNYFRRTHDIIYQSLLKSDEYIKNDSSKRIIPFIQSFTYKASKMGKFYVENQVAAALKYGDGSFFVWNAESNYKMLWKALYKLESIRKKEKVLNFKSLKENLLDETS
ncbi:hypothetical protein KAU43_06755 [candidate division WOR-3 bacterium]|nr:hypothetical protein [candidate division WOR-3 bacterium]